MAMMKLRLVVRRWMHDKQIKRSLSIYSDSIGLSPGSRQKHSDSGTFGEQVDRLFALGDASESSLLEKLARGAVGCCLSNTYYKPADFLSDIADLLESWTFLSADAGGEPPLARCEGPERRRKLELVTRRALLPIKAGAIETCIQHYVSVAGKRLPYQRLVAFERAFARLAVDVEQHEIGYVEREVNLLVDAWAGCEPDARQSESPAALVQLVSSVLHGEVRVEVEADIRLLAPGLPFRISTIVAENREHLLRAAFELASRRI